MISFWFLLQCQSMAFLFILRYTIVLKQFSVEWRSVNDEYRSHRLLFLLFFLLFFSSFQQISFEKNESMCRLSNFRLSFIGKSFFVFSSENCRVTIKSCSPNSLPANTMAGYIVRAHFIMGF